MSSFPLRYTLLNNLYLGQRKIRLNQTLPNSFRACLREIHYFLSPSGFSLSTGPQLKSVCGKFVFKNLSFVTISGSAKRAILHSGRRYQNGIAVRQSKQRVQPHCVYPINMSERVISSTSHNM